MDAYRLYFVDKDGAPLGAFDFTSADDSLATAAARQFGCERGADLWCGPRMVGSWRAERLGPPDARTTESVAEMFAGSS